MCDWVNRSHWKSQTVNFIFIYFGNIIYNTNTMITKSSIIQSISFIAHLQNNKLNSSVHTNRRSLSQLSLSQQKPNSINKHNINSMFYPTQSPHLSCINTKRKSIFRLSMKSNDNDRTNDNDKMDILKLKIDDARLLFGDIFVLVRSF